MKLVFLENNKIVTDSLMIASAFNKEHKHVLRDIESLECSAEFSQSNFGQSTYTNDRGRKYPKYFITQDGFSFLVMGYTGKEAARFKEMYINEFNRMRDRLATPQIPQSLPEALRLAASLAEEKEELQQRIALDRPKVVFAEALETSKDSILVAQMAILLKQNGFDIGEVRLFRWLRENGYLIKSGSEYNLPTQRSMELKIMEVKIGARPSNSTADGFRQTRTPKITGKGQIYFINKFKALQNLPA